MSLNISIWRSRLPTLLVRGLGLPVGTQQKTFKTLNQRCARFFHQSYPKTPSEILDAAIEVKVNHVDGSLVGDGNLTNIESGEPVSVEVIFDFDAVRWFKGFDYLGSDVRQSTTIGRRE